MQGMGSASDYRPGPTPSKGLHPVVWVLVCVAGLLLVIAVALVATGLYVAHRFSEYPVEATATVLSLADPDLEILSTNKVGRTITFREKSTGKTSTVSIDDIQNGSFQFRTAAGREASIEAGGRKITFGRQRLPDWLPPYPNASVKRSMSIKDTSEQSGSQTFETEDGAAKVLKFYEQSLGKAGLTLTRSSGTELTARDNNRQREASITASTAGEGSRVILSYTAKD